ncbi:MAG: MFS transporter [Bacteroides sp.]|nr:MFS transporter [Bacteroides sp.]
MEGKTSLANLLPALFGFYIVGFCDMVGVSASYVQSDFQLGNVMAGLLPAITFIWFLFLSAPVTALIRKIGCKKTVLYGMWLTVLGMLIPFFVYSLPGYFIAFAWMGVGNVLMQIALNPLLSCVLSGNALSVSLTSGQMIKGVSSFCGPFIAAFAMSFWGCWYYVFPIFGVLTLLSACWLLFAPVQERGMYIHTTTREAFALLKDRDVLLLFLAVFLQWELMSE